MEHTASASISLAHRAGAESISHRFGCGTGGYAARTTPMRAALPLKVTNARTDRAEERARTNTLRAQIDELNAALAMAHAAADRALTEERQRADRLNEQVEALLAEVMRAEKQVEAVIGRAERTEAARDAERARAEALCSPSMT